MYDAWKTSDLMCQARTRRRRFAILLSHIKSTRFAEGKILHPHLASFPHLLPRAPPPVCALPSCTFLLPPMAGNRSKRRFRGANSVSASSSRAADTIEGGWKHCKVSQGQLDHLSTTGYLPALEVAYVRPGLVAVGEVIFLESTPNHHEKEQVCFVHFLLMGLGFPIHPFL